MDVCPETGVRTRSEPWIEGRAIGRPEIRALDHVSRVSKLPTWTLVQAAFTGLTSQGHWYWYWFRSVGPYDTGMTIWTPDRVRSWPQSG